MLELKGPFQLIMIMISNNQLIEYMQKPVTRKECELVFILKEEVGIAMKKSMKSDNHINIHVADSWNKKAVKNNADMQKPNPSPGSWSWLNSRDTSSSTYEAKY